MEKYYYHVSGVNIVFCTEKNQELAMFLSEYLISGLNTSYSETITISLSENKKAIDGIKRMVDGADEYEVNVFANNKAKQWITRKGKVTCYNESPVVWIIGEQDSLKYMVMCENLSWIHNYILRIVRDILLAVNEKNNCEIYHGALCEFESCGILILGEKGSGKSTLLSHMIKNKANYISNDRVFIKKDKSNVLMSYGFPLPIRLGVGTLKGFKEYSNLLPELENEDYEKKYKFSIMEVVRNFECRYKDSCVVKVIVVPEIDLNQVDKKVIFEVLTKNDAKGIIEKNDYSEEDPKFRSGWVQANRVVKDYRIEKSIYDLPVIRVKYAKDSDLTAGEILNFLKMNNLIC